MQVINNSKVEKHNLPGLEHQTLAGRQTGLGSFEIWRQTISPGATTPVHRHDCEEVIMALKGDGVCHAEGQTYHFAEDETLVIPANVVHQICNEGDRDLYIVATLAMAPVAVETEDGQPMPLPWDNAS